MEIACSEKCCCHPFLPFEDVRKHFLVFRTNSMNKINDLIKNRVIRSENWNREVPSLSERGKHLTLAVIKAIPVFGHLIALVHRATKLHLSSLKDQEFEKATFPSEEDSIRIHIENVKSPFEQDLRPDVQDYYNELKEQTKTLTTIYLDREAISHNFEDILCPKDTALTTSSEKGIHANLIEMPDGEKYITTQYPKEDCEIFWELCLENSNLIIDLTQPGYKDQQECADGRRGFHPYYPKEKNAPLEYGNMKVSCKEKTLLEEGFVLYELNLTNQKTGATKVVHRLHYQKWQDFGGTSVDDLLKIATYMDQYAKGGETPVVHCAAGVGRTGTLITAKTMQSLHKKGQLLNKNIWDDMKTVIMIGRRARGPMFVQKIEQMHTLFKICDALN